MPSSYGPPPTNGFNTSAGLKTAMSCLRRLPTVGMTVSLTTTRFRLPFGATLRARICWLICTFGDAPSRNLLQLQEVIGSPVESGLHSSRSNSLAVTHSGEPIEQSVQLVSQTLVAPPEVTEMTTIGSAARACCAMTNSAATHRVAVAVRTRPHTVLSTSFMLSPLDRDRSLSRPLIARSVTKTQ